MAETIYVVGPEWSNEKWIFLCPECDDDRVTGVPPEVERLCTVDWLEGQLLSGDKLLGFRSCYCFETDPLEDKEDATDRERRFFYYRTVAFKLGGGGRRVDLPLCVMAERRIERVGQKGIAFVFDVAFTNGAAMQRMLQPDSIDIYNLESQYRKVRFCQLWIQEVLSRGVTYRRRARPSIRMLRGLSSTTPSWTTSSSWRSSGKSAMAPLNMQQHHTLVDLYAEAVRKANKPKVGRPKKKKANITFGRGYCGRTDKQGIFQKCERFGPPSRISLYCEVCGLYYHMPCFFQAHFCQLML